MMYCRQRIVVFYCTQECPIASYLPDGQWGDPAKRESYEMLGLSFEERSHRFVKPHVRCGFAHHVRTDLQWLRS